MARIPGTALRFAASKYAFLIELTTIKEVRYSASTKVHNSASIKEVHYFFISSKYAILLPSRRYGHPGTPPGPDGSEVRKGKRNGSRAATPGNAAVHKDWNGGGDVDGHFYLQCRRHGKSGPGWKGGGEGDGSRGHCNHCGNGDRGWAANTSSGARQA